MNITQQNKELTNESSISGQHLSGYTDTKPR